ncbi:MAG: protein phosphatase [Pseudonocardia sp.]|jgi:protein phosphatase|nr:protein phosphatase [Pseudonocardia sp.]
MTVTVRSAAGSDIGRRRAVNQDSAYTSSRLLAVADGMGGHAHGEVASAVAISTIQAVDADLERADLHAVDLLATLGDAMSVAAQRLTEAAYSDPELRGTGTTLVALLLDGTRVGVGHIGDSRAYVLRDDELHQLTHDHTLVQSLVDEGKLTPDEAITHPRRSVLVRTLQEGSPVEPDLFPIEGQVGDRFLVCSDGVTAVLSHQQIYEILTEVAEPADVVDRIIEAANEGGGPDNITCVVADLVDGTPADGGGFLFGAAAEQTTGL